jgi:hypothetical protein
VNSGLLSFLLKLCANNLAPLCAVAAKRRIIALANALRVIGKLINKFALGPQGYVLVLPGVTWDQANSRLSWTDQEEKDRNSCLDGEDWHEITPPSVQDINSFIQSLR